jgi:hypothetical protein
LLDVVGISSEEAERHMKGQNICQSIHSSNDCTNGNFRPTQDYVNEYKNEEIKQKLKPGTTERNFKKSNKAATQKCLVR